MTKIYLYGFKKTVELKSELIPELKRKSSPIKTIANPHHINIVVGNKKLHHYISGVALSYLKSL